MGKDNYNSDFLSVNLEDYPNIGINFQISTLLFIILLIVIISTIIINYRRYCSIQFVKKLIRYKTVGENKARELSSLRLKKSLIRIALSSNRISKLVSYIGKKEYTYEEYSKMIKKKKFKEEKIDYQKSRVFIKEDMYEEAYDIAEENSPTVLSTVLFCILMISVFVCLILFLPELLNSINNLMNK